MDAPHSSVAATPQAGGEPEILLVSLPWTNVIEPNLGLALLKAILNERGVRARVLHLNLFALEFLRAATYEGVSIVYALNDFLFSFVLDPQITSAQQRALRSKAHDLCATGAFGPANRVDVEPLIDNLLRLRAEVIPSWLERWAHEIAAQPARIIGFTCMFDQTIASLALAKLIRQRAPDKLLVMGGYAVRNPTGAMIMRSHPWIDAICTGEGEHTIVDLARHMRGELPIVEVRGILHRDDGGAIVATAPPPLADLNRNPAPDYDDFFADTARLSAEHRVDVRPASLPLENSRGCWWGATRHCVFCGIDDADLAYRHRSPERVLETLKELRQRYGMRSFRFSDYILPHGFYKSLLPLLAEQNPPFVLSTELKANVREEHVRLLAKAGFHEVQPGIESFSSNVLKKMDKGVTAIQNVFCLKLGRRYAIRILYNILMGFPDDALEDYERMAVLLPKIAHFDPPVSCIPVQVTRYAPLQTDPTRFGIRSADYGPTYELIFSQDYQRRSGFSYQDFCYYYERTWDNSISLDRAYSQIKSIVDKWGVPQTGLEAHLHVEARLANGSIRIVDTRGGNAREISLDRLAAEVLAAADAPITREALLTDLTPRARRDEVLPVIEDLIAQDLIIEEDARLLSLVLPDAPLVAGSFRTGVILPEPTDMAMGAK